MFEEWYVFDEWGNQVAGPFYGDLGKEAAQAHADNLIGKHTVERKR